MADLWKTLLFVAAFGAPTALEAEAISYGDRERIKAAVQALAEAEVQADAEDAVRAVMADLGLALPVAEPLDMPQSTFVSVPGAMIEMVDIRLLLAQIAVQAGARDHIALVRAQGEREHDVILLRGGFVTLTDFLALAETSPAKAFVSRSGERVVLTRPLAIWSDAGLTIRPGDALDLDQESGSFLANLGWLDVDGAQISGMGNANVGEPSFRPFVLTAAQGRMTARAAEFDGLGFGTSPVLGGVSIINSGLHAPDTASFVVDSTLRDVNTLALIGTAGSRVSGNVVDGAAETAILVSHVRGGVVASNRIVTGKDGQGIRVSAGSETVKVSNNHLTGSARTGITVDQDSRDVTIVGNVVTAGGTTGIAVRQASCVDIRGNLVAMNDGSAISLTDAEDTHVSGNALLFNDSAGFLLRDQARARRVGLTGNVLVGNAEGFRGATAGKPLISGNDLDGQLPRIFAGDLSHLTAVWLRTEQDAGLETVARRAPCPDAGGEG